MTNWLWDSLMGPLTKKLVESGISRAILIPQDLLGLFPLHAAWTLENGKRRHALDDVCYSYAPNALSLISSRKIKEQTSDERLLAIDEPYLANAVPLPNSKAEVMSVCGYFSKPTSFSKTSATWKSVRDSLPIHDVFHFSCHGAVDFSKPLNSGLIMANDKVLSLRDFLSIELKGARLAALSACETGMSDTKNADEVIGLPSGLIHAGVAGVAASLWPVSDLSTMMLMTHFYRLWREGGMDPPNALRKAQIWVRDSSNCEKFAYFRKLEREVKVPKEALRTVYRTIGFSDPKANDFEHPFYWAAFTYTGI